MVADCQQFAAVFAEDVRFMAAVRAGVAAHVFDESQHRHGDFVEHGFGFFRVQQGDVLRGGDDDRACHRDLLGEGELGVAGAGRQVDDEVVKVFPAGFAEELQEGLGDDGAAPDHRGVFFDEVAEREGLQAVARDRLHGAAVGAFRAGCAAEHARLAGAVDVGIEQAGRRAQLVQGDGEVDGKGGFANTAFAGGDGDDVFYAGVGLQAALDVLALDRVVKAQFGGINAERLQAAAPARFFACRREAWDEGDAAVVVFVDGAGVGEGLQLKDGVAVVFQEVGVHSGNHCWKERRAWATSML